MIFCKLRSTMISYFKIKLVYGENVIEKSFVELKII